MLVFLLMMLHALVAITHCSADIFDIFQMFLSLHVGIIQHSHLQLLEYENKWLACLWMSSFCASTQPAVYNRHSDERTTDWLKQKKHKESLKLSVVLQKCTFHHTVHILATGLLYVHDSEKKPRLQLNYTALHTHTHKTHIYAVIV